MLLSVIIPVYNVELFLDRCIQSITQQTYKEMEIILVDDGSIDKSSQQCDLWAQKDVRIKTIHKKNEGLSSARNAGIDIARGEVLSFIDSDDFIEPDMYRTMLAAMRTSGKDIACCGRIVDLWGKREKREYSRSKPKIYSREEAMKEVLCLRDIDVSACDKLYRKELFEGIRYPKGKISEDAAIIFQLLEKANGVIHVGRDFYHYVFRRNSISKATYSHANYDAYENCLHIMEFFKQYHPNLVPFAQIYGTQICASLLGGMYLNQMAITEYKNDFEVYRTMFKAGFPLVLIHNEISLKVKIRHIFICFGRLDWFVSLKRLLGK